MTITDLARVFKARGRGKRWVAKCPAHPDRTPSLSIFEDERGLSVHCFSGCSKDDVLAAVGLSWKDLKPRRDWLPPKEYAALLKWRTAEEERARNLRIGTWILRFAENGYTREDRIEDVSCVLAAAHVLSNKEITAWRSLFETHMDRIMAANHCMERRMLPQVAKLRKEWRIESL